MMVVLLFRIWSRSMQSARCCNLFCRIAHVSAECVPQFMFRDALCCVAPCYVLICCILHFSFSWLSVAFDFDQLHGACCIARAHCILQCCILTCCIMYFSSLQHVGTDFVGLHSIVRRYPFRCICVLHAIVFSLWFFVYGWLFFSMPFDCLWKSWTSYDRVLNKSRTSSERVLEKYR